METIFTKIIKGEIPCYKIAENDSFFAFLDISPLAKGHTLVVPKKHYRNMLDMDAEAAATLFSVIPTISSHLKETLGAKGLNIVNNNEEVAGQTVFHTHIHLLPRYDKEDGLEIHFKTNEPDFPALAQLAQSLYLGE